MKIVFRGEELTINKAQYSNGRPALSLVDKDGMPYMTASVNLPDYHLDHGGYTFIKDYSENQGILKALTEAKVVRDTGIRASSGMVEVPLVEILM